MQNFYGILEEKGGLTYPKNSFYVYFENTITF
jgi:hypothetical protein